MHVCTYTLPGMYPLAHTQSCTSKHTPMQRHTRLTLTHDVHTPHVPSVLTHTFTLFYYVSVVRITTHLLRISHDGRPRDEAVNRQNLLPCPICGQVGGLVRGRPCLWDQSKIAKGKCWGTHVHTLLPQEGLGEGDSLHKHPPTFLLAPLPSGCPLPPTATPGLSPSPLLGIRFVGCTYKLCFP